MYFLWLPYVELQDERGTSVTVRDGGSPSTKLNPIRLGNISIYPDKESAWQEIGIQRPSFFNSYVEFSDSPEKMGSPCRGSIIVIDEKNEKWLEQYAKRLVAVLYFLTDKGKYKIGNHRLATEGLPMELFHYLPWMSGEDKGLTMYQLKNGNITESYQSLRMTPPLPCRNSRRTIQVKYHDYSCLIEILFNNPEHRLITACLHYFLAQQSDLMSQDMNSDFAHFCACLEACFGIKEPKISDQLIENLKSLYLDDSNFIQYIKGLYACRSLYVHGLSGFSETEKLADTRLQSYEKFASSQCNYSIIRALCHDVLHIQLIKRQTEQKLKDSLLFRFTDPSILLIQAFQSEQYYKKIKRRANQKESIKNITSLNPGEQDADIFIEEGKSFFEYVNFRFVKDEPIQVINVLGIYLKAYQKTQKSDMNTMDMYPIPKIMQIYKDNNMNPSPDHFRDFATNLGTLYCAIDWSEPDYFFPDNEIKEATLKIIYRLATFFIELYRQ